MAQTIARAQRFLKLFCSSLLILMLAAPPLPARADAGQSIIRDAEIENTMRGWLDPLIKAAGIDPKIVHIVIVQSPDINSFVAGGSNIFIYTGLILKTENPGEMIGVMAHELGHIAGGHLINGRDAMERASYESILGTVLGLGAAMAGAGGNAAMAGAGIGSSMAMNGFLAHSRVIESSADQAAMRFMLGAQYDPSGLESFFHKLESEELLPADQQSPYMRTHPLTRDRIDAIELKIQDSPYKGKSFPAEWTEQHARMKAKLLGFINPGQVPWVYADKDNSMPARYARAIAAYRQNHVPEALKDADGLIASEPNNPYFQELKGQMLMDFGRVAEAIPYYRKASAAVPNSGLIRMALGHAILESNGGRQSQAEAAQELERALQDEPRSGELRHLLATAYGQMGNENMAKIELAEEAVLQRRFEDARMMARAVVANAPKGSREALEAKDIIEQAAVLKKGDDGQE